MIRPSTTLFFILALLAATIFYGVAFTAFTLGDYFFENKNSTNPEFPTMTFTQRVSPIYNAIVRIHSGTGICSGVIVSNEYLLTAAHCIVDDEGSLDRGEIKVFADDNRDTNTVGKAIIADHSQDIGLVVGDFLAFKKMPVHFESIDFVKETEKNIIKACGFPRNTKLICYDFKPVGNYRFMIRGSGFMYKGMSGGPALLNGEVVGVNSGVMDVGMVIGPIIGIFDGLGIKREDGR